MLTLSEIIDRFRQAEPIENFHELDTIERLVVPVLALADWNIDLLEPMLLQRGNSDRRSEHRRFDLQLFKPENPAPRIVIECKEVRTQLNWEGYGWSKRQTDHLRQLRVYCNNGSFKFLQGWTQPILTNGDRWIIVSEAFISTTHLATGITAENKDTFIVADCRLTDPQFPDTIINRIKDQ